MPRSSVEGHADFLIERLQRAGGNPKARHIRRAPDRYVVAAITQPQWLRFRHEAIVTKQRSASSRQRRPIDTPQNLRPAKQRDTFVDTRAKLAIRLKLRGQFILGVVVRIED